jgi:hypothetical protein
MNEVLNSVVFYTLLYLIFQGFTNKLFTAVLLKSRKADSPFSIVVMMAVLMPIPYLLCLYVLSVSLFSLLLLNGVPYQDLEGSRSTVTSLGTLLIISSTLLTRIPGDQNE